MQIMVEYQKPVLRPSVFFRHLIGLPGRSPVVYAVFGLVVPPEVCQKPVDVKGWEPLAKPQPVVVIHGVVQAEIERSGLLKRLFCKKYRRLGNKVFSQQPAQRVSPTLVIFIAGNPPADLTIPGINVSTVAKAPVKAYLPVLFSNLGQGPIPIGVIRVQPCQDLARGHGKALVNGIGLPLVFFADEGHPVFVSPDNIQGTISGPPIHNDVLQIKLSTLVKYALNGSLDKFPLIQGGGDYGYLHKTGLSASLYILLSGVNIFKRVSTRPVCLS